MVAATRTAGREVEGEYAGWVLSEGRRRWDEKKLICRAWAKGERERETRMARVFVCCMARFNWWREARRGG